MPHWPCDQLWGSALFEALAVSTDGLATSSAAVASVGRNTSATEMAVSAMAR